ncbi:ribosomal protein S18 acetylase RimI-like enzyme [Inhella inkyongensis]|uniref:Ribosomal protein S18 acetylase RimI-like enzyme n=1 Tax=Inhella inkyongensis TaxID=392593 RepID=A0A840S049_9BURK|nr:GNAT family N-acetyltransferase [Inhella inkyongensis]MBB5203173.1 ribosomal protein S18 acetylase RimI-like enzyme [Inhella inkyongensis]
MSIQVLPLATISYETWLNLWLPYVDGQLEVDSPLHRHSYERLVAGQELRGLVLQEGGAVLGLAHFYLHPSTWALQPACYIQDLYICPQARGRGLARHLIEAVRSEAKAGGAYVLHWNTRADNVAARALYERIAQRSDRVMYLMPLA